MQAKLDGTTNYSPNGITIPGNSRGPYQIEFCESDHDSIRGWYASTGGELDFSSRTWRSFGGGPEIQCDYIYGPYETEQEAVDFLWGYEKDIED